METGRIGAARLSPEKGMVKEKRGFADEPLKKYRRRLILTGISDRKKSYNKEKRRMKVYEYEFWM